MYNKLTLIGRVGGDPEYKVTNKGTEITGFSLATSESWKDDSGEWHEETDWHNITMFGKNAIRANEKVRKGDLLLIEGKVRYEKWNDKDGNKRTTTKVIASFFRQLTKSEKTAMESALPYQEPVSVADIYGPADQHSPYAPAPDDDLPF